MPESSSPNPNLEAMTRFQILIAMGLTAVVLMVCARLWLWLDPAATLLPLQWSIRATALGLGLGLAITVASAGLYYLWDSYRNSANYYREMIIKPLVLPDLIWLGLLPGMSEELLFRGVMLPALGLNWFGVLLSSLCFGVLHFSGSQQWSYVLWATVIGTTLGLSAVLTGNLLVPVVAHITTNLLSSCFWKLKDRDWAKKN